MLRLSFWYWLSTGFVVLVGLAGVLNIVQYEPLMQINRALHLPDYLAPFLGTLKVAGAITIALPALRRFHEAAYAGFFFYFMGATYVLLANKTGPAQYGMTLLILLAVIVSYVTALRRQATPAPLA